MLSRDQLALHSGVQPAVVGFGTLVAHDVLSALALRQRTGIPSRGLAGGRGMGHDVTIDPDDRVSSLELQHLRMKCHTPNLDDVLVPDGGVRASRDRHAHNGQGSDRPECGDRKPCHPSAQRAHLAATSTPWSFFACSRCAAKAGRTSTSSCLSSPFSVVGINRWFNASSTAWWYATSRSM